jgi:hypothetical protein
MTNLVEIRELNIRCCFFIVDEGVIGPALG